MGLGWYEGGKDKVPGICYSPACTSHAQERFTVRKVAADWHELVILQRIMRSSIAHANEQLDRQYSMRTYHCPSQTHLAFTP